jgi:hypothetical protein
VKADFPSVSFDVFVLIAFAVLAAGAIISGIGVWRNLRAEPMIILSSREEK